MATGEPKWVTATTTDTGITGTGVVTTVTGVGGLAITGAAAGSGLSITAASDSWSVTRTVPADPWATFPPAPVSDVQTCALAWLKGGDWSAVGPLLDALEEQNRSDDVREIRRAVASRAIRATLPGADRDAVQDGGFEHRYAAWWNDAMTRLWFDLFDLHGTLAHIAAKSKG